MLPVKRKWGWYWTIIDRPSFKVKLLRFHKGGKCSMQYHNMRNELWLFLKGSGSMNGLAIGAGEYFYVEVRKLHQYYAKKTTWVLEIQYGEKCEEEDIVRL
jgi:mannose-6-phosphate isomerase